MFVEIPVVVFDCECEVCGHKWISRKTVLPTHCPGAKCSNPSGWNRSEEVMSPEDYVPENVRTPEVVLPTNPVTVPPASVQEVSTPIGIWLEQKPYLDEQTGEMVYCEKHYKTGKVRLIKRVSQYD